MSVIASRKAHRPEHRARLEIALALKEHFGDRLDLFGRGFKPMPDKAEALLPYRFHVALENSSLPHYMSEKLPDALLAGCYPFYYGAPNVADYFPSDAVVSLDAHDMARSITVMEKAIAENWDQQHRDALREARNRVLYQHNLFPLLVRLANQMQQGVHSLHHPENKPLRSIKDVTGKAPKRRHSLITKLQNSFASRKLRKRVSSVLGEDA